MDRALEQQVFRRASGVCEYCRFPDEISELRHCVDHIIALQHGGQTVVENLALCCGRCNRHKGPNIAGVDPQTGSVVRLFHPRRDKWSEHFRWEHARLVGITPVGRATLDVLSINHPYRVAVRRVLLDARKLRLD